MFVSPNAVFNASGDTFKRDAAQDAGGAIYDLTGTVNAGNSSFSSDAAARGRVCFKDSCTDLPGRFMAGP